MPLFEWEAKTRTGEVKKGEMDAANADVVGQRLRQQGLNPSKIKKKGGGLNLRISIGSAITTKDLVVFTRQFSTMINAGLPLVQCLDLLGSQNDNPAFKEVIIDVKSTVESGKTLAEALGKHPKVFNRLFVNLVAAGEAGGVLDTILNRLASYIEKNQKIVKQIKGAMVYPAIVISVSVVVTLVLLIFVIPVFQKMFNDFGAALPAPTQIMIDLSEFTRRNVLYIILTIAGLIGGFIATAKNKRGKEILDEVSLILPAVGQLIRKVAVANFTRTMGTMLSSGVNILESLDIVAATASNSVIEKGLRFVRARVSEGKPMAQPLSEVKIFPPMVVQMIQVGESTGAMDAMLNKIADFYDTEVDDAVGTMMAMLEPLIMGFLAVVLGGFVVAMYLPVFSMAGGVSTGQ